MFRYFEAPESEMSLLLASPTSCRFCGETKQCFELADNSGAGCFSCLRDGRFGFFHTTEAGFVDESGLHVDYSDDESDEEPRVFVVSPEGVTSQERNPHPTKSTRPTVSTEAVQELWRTPDFPTWNEVAWPVHCQEFMTFLGEWTSLDFSGRDQFLGMTDSEYHALWPQEDHSPEWGVTYFAFRCPACRRYQGVVDFS